MNTTTSQAQIFRAKYAENAASEMLDVVEAIGKRSKRIAQIALGVSMPHQIGYLISLAIPHMHLSAVGIIEAIGMVLIAIAVPVVSDLLILTCIETIGGAAVERRSKTRAFILMLIPVSVSGVVNFLAPAPDVIKGLALFLVLSIPVAVALKFVRADFDKIEAMETEIALARPVGKAGRVVSKNELKARKRAGYDQMTAAEKRAWTKKYAPRAPKMPANVEQLLAAQAAVAPVSPAPIA